MSPHERQAMIDAERRAEAEAAFAEACAEAREEGRAGVKALLADARALLEYRGSDLDVIDAMDAGCADLPSIRDWLRAREPAAAP